MLKPSFASILSGLLVVGTATAAPFIYDNDDTSVTTTKRSIQNGKAPYTVHLYVEKVATTIETITCNNYEELFDELLRRNKNWEKEWPGSFGWINSNVPKKGKGRRSVQAAKRKVHPVQVFKDGPIEGIEAFSEKELHDEVLKLNPNHDKEFPEEVRWPAKRSRSVDSVDDPSTMPEKRRARGNWYVVSDPKVNPKKPYKKALLGGEGTKLLNQLLKLNPDWDREYPDLADRLRHNQLILPLYIDTRSVKAVNSVPKGLESSKRSDFGDDLQQKWPEEAVPTFGHKRSIPPSSVPPATVPHGHPDYVYKPESEDSSFEERTVSNLDADVGASHTNRRPTKINKRYDGWTKPSCNKGSFGGKADYNHINELMDTLLMQSGKPNVGAGPKTCAMAGCKDGNSIWFCNDTKQDLTIGSYSEIQYAARIIRNACATNNGGTNTLYSGQVFATDQSWNVITRGGCPASL